MTIVITGASQQVSKNRCDEWEARYVCHRCGEEFACSYDYCKTEKEAREQSNTRFDVQQRRFCSRCGYKLTTKDGIPDDVYIAELNRKIDVLHAEAQNDRERIKILQDMLNGASDAERIAIRNGWVRAVIVDPPGAASELSPDALADIEAMFAEDGEGDAK